MKILSICGILPIPDLREDENDIVFRMYDYYLEKYPQNEIDFILPVPYANYLMSKLSERCNRWFKLKQIGSYSYRGYNITVFPYFIFMMNLNQYTMMHKSLHYQNKHKFKNYENYDLIHAHRIYPEGYLALKMSQELSIPYALTVRKEERYFNGGKTEKRALKVLDGAAKITTPTAYSYKLLKPRYSNMELVPHGIEKKFFVDRQSDRQSSTEQAKTVKILTVARLLELKNIEFVISTLASMKEDFSFRYIIVGEGPHRDKIEECIRENQMQNYVQMESYVPFEKIQEIYARGDIFILTSFREAFGRVYFEAMAAGVPVICSRDTGVDGIFEDGISGFSVDPHDDLELRKIFTKLFEDRELRHKVGQSGKNLVSKYTWPVITDIYHEIFTEAAGL